MMIQNLFFDKKRECFFLFLILCLASFLFLKNLGNQYLWQDEAQTALLGRSILTHGVPIAYDGKNFFSQEEGRELGKNYIYKHHPWLQSCLAAASFAVFGESTFSARLPFALFGIATVFLTYFFSRSLWEDKKIAVIAAFLLLFSVPFLILSRQCRYYSPAAFFSLLGLYSYIRVIDKKKYAGFVFVVAATFLFHSLDPFCFILLGTVSLHALLFHRNLFKNVFILCFVVTLINLPWIAWTYPQKHLYMEHAFIGASTKFLKDYLSQTAHIFSPFLLFVLLLIGIFRYKKTKEFFAKNSIFWKKLSLFFLFIFCFYSGFVLLGLHPFFRYLILLIPIYCILAALIIKYAFDSHMIFGVALIALLLLFSNLHNYLYEITHDYDGPIEGIVKYLNHNGTEQDVVAISYGDLPLKFYTKMKVIGLLTGEDISPAKEADWIIWRKYLASPREKEPKKYLLRHVVWSNYQKIIIKYPDIPFENREELPFHKFRTVKNEDGVVLYRRIR